MKPIRILIAMIPPSMALDIIEHGATSPWCGNETAMIQAPKAQNPPTVPSKPIGETSCISGQAYNYSFMSTDTDGDWIMYLVTFGEGNGNQTGYYPPGQVVTVSHVWNVPPVGKTNSRQVKAIAYDSRGAMSIGPYSEPLTVTVRG